MSSVHRAPASRLLTSAGLLAVVAAVVVSGTALAGKPGATTSGSLAGPVLVQDLGADARVNHRDTVTFTVSTSATKPYVGVRCYQGASFVYDSYVGYFDAAWFAKAFTLDSSYWGAGTDATCTARLFTYDNRGRERVQSTLPFVVAP